jgi:hypothetical protein
VFLQFEKKDKMTVHEAEVSKYAESKKQQLLSKSTSAKA